MRRTIKSFPYYYFLVMYIYIFYIFRSIFSKLINTLSVNKVIKLPIYYIHWNLIYLYGLTLWPCLICVTCLLYISICRHHSCPFIIRQFQDNVILLRMVCPDCIIRGKLWRGLLFVWLSRVSTLSSSWPNWLLLLTDTLRLQSYNLSLSD